MAIFGSIKQLYHSITTPDHYASYRGDRPSGHDAVPLAPPSAGSSTSLNRSAQLNGANASSSDIQMSANMGPSIKVAWGRIIEYLEEAYPELHDQILDGATSRDVDEFCNDLDIVLPADVRESICTHDGQERGGRPTGLLFGIELMDLESIVEEWSIWRNAAIKLNEASRRGTLRLGAQRCVPAEAVQCVYSHPSWVPLAKDGGGNNIAVDLAPGPQGTLGQIILFGRDFDTKYVVAQSWAHFLDAFANDIQHGRPYVDDDIENPIFCMREKGRMVAYLDVLRRRALRANEPKSMVGPRVSTPKLVVDNVMSLEPVQEASASASVSAPGPTATSEAAPSLASASPEPAAPQPSEPSPEPEAPASSAEPEASPEPSAPAKKKKSKKSKKAKANLDDLKEEPLDQAA